MKFLSEKKCIYLLLIHTLLSVIVTIISLPLTYPDNANIIKENIPFQAISFLITLFIYLNISKINPELKIASFLIIIKAFISLCEITVLNMLPLTSFFSLPLSDILEFITLSLSIPIYFYLYNGWAILVSQKTKKIILTNKWKNLITPSITLGVISILLHINNLFGDPLIYPQIPEIPFVLLFGLMAFTVYLEILKTIYLFKTAKAL